MKNMKLLVVVDESPATKRALSMWLRWLPVAEFPSLSWRMPSFTSSPNRSSSEAQKRARLQAYKSRWISVIEMTEQRALDRANTVLRRGGFGNGAIEAHYCHLVDGSRASQGNLKLARMRKCDTVVIGRKSLSWLGELIHGDPAEEFVRQGKGFTIWVVE